MPRPTRPLRLWSTCHSLPLRRHSPTAATLIFRHFAARYMCTHSAEAEFFGAMLAAKEVIFIRELLIDLGFSIDGASIINCDSKAAVGMAFIPVAFKKTKHILRAAEVFRDLVNRGVIALSNTSLAS